ncbi:MAG TPA: DUF2911 domain-containing protein [Thermoanaerobaculia bacterium]|nr:DUF2911 domain-containing protein [Thermoanaerobaculia bacterium]
MHRALRFALATVASLILLQPSLLSAQAPQQDDPTKRPSPMGMSRITLGDAYVRVVYSRPGKKGRAIFGTKESGALVPFGEVWRTGANEGTEITVTRDVTIGGTRLAAGTYTMFTTPGAESWKIHFNSALGLWGSRAYDAKNDVATVTVTPKALEAEVEWFTIALDKTDTGADLVLKWATTEVRTPVRLP